MIFPPFTPWLLQMYYLILLFCTGNHCVMYFYFHRLSIKWMNIYGLNWLFHPITPPLSSYTFFLRTLLKKWPTPEFSKDPVLLWLYPIPSKFFHALLTWTLSVSTLNLRCPTRGGWYKEQDWHYQDNQGRGNWVQANLCPVHGDRHLSWKVTYCSCSFSTGGAKATHDPLPAFDTFALLWFSPMASSFSKAEVSDISSWVVPSMDSIREMFWIILQSYFSKCALVI